MTITVVFDPPLPSDSPTVFNTKAFTLVGDLNTFATQVNAAIVTMNTSIADTVHAATSKATPVDADEIPLMDSAATFALKKLTWANLKATLATWIGSGTIAGSFTTISASGNATLGDAEATDAHTIKGVTTVLANSANPAMKITQTGAGNAFVVEDSASTDSTPFVIDQYGNIGSGLTNPGSYLGAAQTGMVIKSTTAYGPQVWFWNSVNDTSAGYCHFRKDRAGATVQSGDALGNIIFGGYDNVSYITSAHIYASVDGTPGDNNMPGRLTLSTRANNAASLTEHLRIDSTGNVIKTSATGSLGYGTGAGGTATQATSRVTTVVFASAKPTGAITLFTAAGSATPATFTVTNAAVAATDTVVLSVKSGTNTYVAFVSAVAASSFNVTFWATTGTASDTPVINFAVIKGSTS